MELTKEVFEKGIGNILEKVADVKADVVKLETKLTAVESKLTAKIDAQTAELKQYTTDAFTTQQVWMDERFKEQIVVYDVRNRVEKLEKEFREFKLHKPVHA